MTDLVEKLMDDLMTVDRIDPERVRRLARKGHKPNKRRLDDYRQLAIQAMTTIRFHLEQDGEL